MLRYVSWAVNAAVLLLVLGTWYVYGALEAVLLVAMLVILAIMLFVLCQLLASRNILFTFVQEGTVKAVMRGGQFDHLLMSFEGFHLNTPRKPWFQTTVASWEVVRNAENRSDSFYDDRPWFMRWIGLYWVGIPPFFSVYTYHFEWNETRNEGGTETLWPRSEDTDFIYISDFTYAMHLPGAETGEQDEEGGNIPIDVLYLVTVAIRNPYRALFSGEDWLKRVGAATNRVGRSYVGRRSFEQLRSEHDSDETKPGEDSFSYQIIALNTRLPDEPVIPVGAHRGTEGLAQRYGVTIRTADLQSVELAGGAGAKVREATVRKYVATQEKAATIAEGEGEAAAILLRGTAESNVIALKGKAEAESLSERIAAIKAGGETGERLAQLDAMSSTGPGKTVVWANNPFPFPQKSKED